jgi:hypothetical protein
MQARRKHIGNRRITTWLAGGRPKKINAMAHFDRLKPTCFSTQLTGGVVIYLVETDGRFVRRLMEWMPLQTASRCAMLVLF